MRGSRSLLCPVSCVLCPVFRVRVRVAEDGGDAFGGPNSRPMAATCRYRCSSVPRTGGRVCSEGEASDPGSS